MNRQQPTLRPIRQRLIAGHHLAWAALVIVSILAGAAMLVVEPLIIIGGVMGLMAGVALFAYPFLGVLAYLVFEYASVSEMFTFTQVLQLGKVVVLATIAAWGIKGMLRRNLRFVSDNLTWWFLIWVLAALFSNLVATNSKVAMQGTIDIFKWFIIYFMIINIVDTLPKWKWTMWILLILAFRMSQFQIRVYGIGLASTGHTDYFIREGLGVGTTAFFGNAGDFGVFMCVMAPLAFYLIKAVDPKILKAIGVVFLMFFVASIFKSGARGNTVGLFSVASVYWFRSRQKLLIGVAMAMAVALWWVTAADVVRERFISAASDERDTTSAQRLSLWTAGVHMFFTNPAIGVGVNNFSNTFLAKYATPEQAAGSATAPHNIFIQCMAELGLPGIISLLTIIYLMFMRNRQMRAMLRENQCRNNWITSFAYGLDLALVGYIVSGSFLSVLYYPYLFILLALVASLHNITKKRVEEGLDKIEETEQPRPLSV